VHTVMKVVGVFIAFFVRRFMGVSRKIFLLGTVAL
jgi:hypothetical protein